MCSSRLVTQPQRIGASNKAFHLEKSLKEVAKDKKSVKKIANLTSNQLPSASQLAYTQFIVKLASTYEFEIQKLQEGDILVRLKELKILTQISR